jgi:hypothetical protein
MTDLSEYLDACRAEIEAALSAALPAPPACPPALADAMRYSLLACDRCSAWPPATRLAAIADWRCRSRAHSS